MFALPVDASWKIDDCEVLVIVTAPDRNGNYDVVNCALCEVGESVTYDYK